MAGKSFQTFGHVDEITDLGILLILFPQLRIHGQRLVDGDIQLGGDHFGNDIHLGVRHIQHTSHIPDGVAGSHGTEGDDLHHPVLPVLSHHVIDDLLAPFETEIHVNIRHGHPLRVQETFKQQLVPDGIQLGDTQGISHQASGRGTPAWPHHDIVIPGVFDKIPHDQEVVHIPHGADGVQLILQPFPKFLCHRLIPLLKPLPAQLV